MFYVVLGNMEIQDLALHETTASVQSRSGLTIRRCQTVSRGSPVISRIDSKFWHACGYGGDGTNNPGGTVIPGDAPGTLTVNNYAQMSIGTLLIDIAGLNAGQFSVLNVLGNANLLQPNAFLDPVLLNGFVPAIGDSFTFMNYMSLTGEFFIHDRNIDGVAEHWVVTYQATQAILTVAPGNVPVPDQGSTFLFLTLGLLALVTYRPHLLRGQS